MTRNGTDVPHICFPALAEELRRRRRGRATIFAVYVSPKTNEKAALFLSRLNRIVRMAKRSTPYIYASVGRRHLLQEAVGLTREVAA